MPSRRTRARSSSSPGHGPPTAAAFFLLSDEGREFIGLAFFDLRAGAYQWLETPAWDITAVDASRDGRILAWVVNEDGYSRLHVRDQSSGQLLDLPPIPAGAIDVLRVSPDGRMLGFLLNQPQHPAEVFILDLATMELTQLTSSAGGGVDPADLIQPELVRFPNPRRPSDPRLPLPPARQWPVSVVVSIHGGPEAQELPVYAYSGLYQYSDESGHWGARARGRRYQGMSDLEEETSRLTTARAVRRMPRRDDGWIRRPSISEGAPNDSRPRPPRPVFRG